MCKVFYYKKYDFNSTTGVLELSFQVDNSYFFTEKIIFPDAPFVLSDEQKIALNHIFFLTHIAFGISYFKAFCPSEIQIESGFLSTEEAAFFDSFYLQGLGEFAVRNHLDLRDKIKFPSTDIHFLPINIHLQNRFLIPVGGGKDSCVSMELLKQTGKKCCAVSIGNPRPIQECIRVSNLPHIMIKRQISPELIELNQNQKVYNGHVPITGMLAFILWAAAILYNYRYITLSCESSANSGNMTLGNLIINHQYSKSFTFEKAFKHLTQSITPKFLYFSLLRPIKEINIARLFAHYCKAYFKVFTSCNKAFKLNEHQRLDRWCGCCDKCRFVFLILAPFMDKETLVQVVGNNPLNDLSQITGYEELLGLCGHKPFECVGEINECRFAFHHLVSNPRWASDIIIQTLKNRVPLDFTNPFTCSTEHFIPKELKYVMEKFVQ